MFDVRHRLNNECNEFAMSPAYCEYPPVLLLLANYADDTYALCLCELTSGANG